MDDKSSTTNKSLKDENVKEKKKIEGPTNIKQYFCYNFFKVLKEKLV